MNYRVEKDVLGEMEVPSDVLWSINTERAFQNFHKWKEIPKDIYQIASTS